MSRSGIRNRDINIGSWFSDALDNTFHIDSQAIGATVGKAALMAAPALAAIPGVGWIAGGAAAGIGGAIALGQGGLNAGAVMGPRPGAQAGQLQVSPEDLQKLLGQGSNGQAIATPPPPKPAGNVLIPLAIAAAVFIL